jgi:2-polyprenyl-6-methoxyphenol hydroxylase-like FAD-dependent oxidoreductase
MMQPCQRQVKDMTYDVVIAGGGPVGLFLACELRLAGASVLVLE